MVIQDGEQHLESGYINFDKVLSTSTLSVSFLVTELLKTIIGALDLLGISFIISSKWLVGDQVTQIFGCAIGWCMGDNLFNRLLPLWFSTRGLQFEWKALQMSLYSNITMLEWMAIVILVFLYGRKKYDQKNFAWLMLVIVSVFPFVLEIAKVILHLEDNVWVLLGIKACFYGVSFAIANSAYNKFEQSNQ